MGVGSYRRGVDIWSDLCVRRQLMVSGGTWNNTGCLSPITRASAALESNAKHRTYHHRSYHTHHPPPTYLHRNGHVPVLCPHAAPVGVDTRTVRLAWPFDLNPLRPMNSITLNGLMNTNQIARLTDPPRRTRKPGNPSPLCRSPMRFCGPSILLPSSSE